MGWLPFVTALLVAGPCIGVLAVGACIFFQDRNVSPQRANTAASVRCRRRASTEALDEYLYDCSEASDLRVSRKPRSRHPIVITGVARGNTEPLYLYLRDRAPVASVRQSVPPRPVVKARAPRPTRLVPLTA